MVKLNGSVSEPLVCVIGTVNDRLPGPPVFAIVGVPVVIVTPAPLNVLLLKSKVPFVNDNCLVAPSVKLFCNVHVAVLAAEPNVHGKSYVNPAILPMVQLPLVAVKIHALVPAVKVVVPFVVRWVNVPYIQNEVLATVCEPLTVRLRKFPVILYTAVPVVSNKLMLTLFASLSAPVLIVLVTAVPPPIHSTVGVPLTVRFVTVPVFQIVLVVALFNTILPVPKLIVRAVEPLELNRPVVSVKVESANVPAVSVNVLVEPIVKLFRKLRVPPTLFTENGKSSVR